MVKLVKVKDIKTKKKSSGLKISVKELISDVKKKLNKEKVEKVMGILEEKYRQLYEAKRVVKKLEKQISEIEEKDISEIDTEDYEYFEEE